MSENFTIEELDLFDEIDKLSSKGFTTIDKFCEIEQFDKKEVISFLEDFLSLRENRYLVDNGRINIKANIISFGSIEYIERKFTNRKNGN